MARKVPTWVLLRYRPLKNLCIGAAPAPTYRQWRDARFKRNAQGLWSDQTGNQFTDERLHQDYEARHEK